MADAASVLSTLPAPLQLALSLGTGIAALGAAVYRIAAKPKDKSAADDKAGPSADAKTLAVAMVAPMGDPNQLRQVVEALNRLNDFAAKALVVMDDIKDEQLRTTAAAGRAEEAAGRVVQAVRDADATIGRLPLL